MFNGISTNIEYLIPKPSRPVGSSCIIRRLHSCKEVRPATKECPVYDTKPSSLCLFLFVSLFYKFKFDSMFNGISTNIEYLIPKPSRPVGSSCIIRRLHSCKEVRPATKECPVYDTKPSSGLSLWGIWSTFSLPLLPDSI